jgi:hypothetical protein
LPASRTALARLPGIVVGVVIPSPGFTSRDASLRVLLGSDSAFMPAGHRPSGSASLLALDLPFESSHRSPRELRIAPDGSLEVLRLHSASGLIDPRRALRLGSIRLPGSARLTVCSQPVHAKRVPSPQRSRDSHFEAFPPPGAVVVSHFLPSCRFGSPISHPRTRGRLQGFPTPTGVPRGVVRPGLLPWFPSRVLAPAALAHGFGPGPSSFTLPASRAAIPGALESCVTAGAALRRRRANPSEFLDLAVTRGFPHVHHRVVKDGRGWVR